MLFCFACCIIMSMFPGTLNTFLPAAKPCTHLKGFLQIQRGLAKQNRPHKAVCFVLETAGYFDTI